MRQPCATLPPYDHVNAWLVVSDGVALVVDPGSDEPAARAGLRRALEHAGVRLVKGVLLTHTHPDHVGGLEDVLALAGGAPVFVHPAEADRLEGVPRPVLLGDGRRLTVGDVIVEALHTPGHSPGHLAFHVVDDGVALVGDLLAGSGSTWVGVPEGNVTAYLASLERVRALRAKRLGPGHGDPITDPEGHLAWARAHRLEREDQVLRALQGEPLSLSALRRAVYPKVDPAAASLAEASLLAHLRKLMREMRVVHLGSDETGPYAARR